MYPTVTKPSKLVTGRSRVCQHRHRFGHAVAQLLGNTTRTWALGQLRMLPGASLNPFNPIVTLKWIEYGVDGDLIIIYPELHSIYLKGTTDPKRQP